MQIGPRIRVGGTLGKFGEKVKQGAAKVGSNPITLGVLGAMTGGATIPALIGALSKGVGTSNAGIGDVATGAATGYGAGKAGDSIDTWLHSLMGSGSPGGASSGGASDAGGGGWMDAAKKLFGGAGDVAGKVLGGGGGGGGGNSLLDGALAASGIASNAADRQRVRGFQDKAADYATADYDKNAPLRDQARSMIQDTSTPDLSALFSNSGNVYDRQRRGMPMGNRVAVQSTY